MREIKFRHWATCAFNRPDFMDYEPELAFQEGNYGVVIANIAITYKNLMQYTGLQDKNGIEVYESDVITFNSRHYVIEYADGYAMFVASSKINGISDPRTFYSLDFMKDIFEVIGNIYENPELLEDIK